MRLEGLLSLKSDKLYYSLYLPSQGWIAVERLQFLGEVLSASHRRAALLKLLGLRLVIESERPSRQADHWVVVDLEARNLETNSDWLRRIIRRQVLPADSPLTATAAARVYGELDRLDFTVHLFD